ncbi:universal stress protein [Vagococcus elongatus]|uniref:Universal stress protein n=1 Tax=Vagococcus elongatus TaxID=180344 RepID=A0A430ANT7_9ENTE|nr:universal stress protein [Vagococcus elongatus]RSU09557.1 hypothetical protein CBF29_11165 [Vagococcus elongatus]
MKEAYQHILIAFDGSVQSEKALEHSLFLAELADGKVTIAQVLDPLIEYYPDDPKIIEEEQEAYSIIQQKIKGLPEEKIEIVVMRGNPKDKLVELAEKKKVDLVVMGATSKHGIKRVIIGSTTSHVINQCPCNVLVIR